MLSTLLLLRLLRPARWASQQPHVNKHVASMRMHGSIILMCFAAHSWGEESAALISNQGQSDLITCASHGTHEPRWWCGTT